MSNKSPLDSVLLGCKKEVDKVGLIEHGVERCCGVVGLMNNEEIDVLDTEGVLGSVGTSLAVFVWTEEE